MEAVIRRIALVLFCFCFSHANAASLEIKEIRLHGIGGYSQNRFTVTIRNDGAVQYTGVSFVAVEGKRRSRISSEDFRRLVNKIEQIHFFGLEERYNTYPLDKPAEVRSTGEATAERTFVTDQRTEIVTVVTSTRTKSVEDYMGAPKGLFELEQLILDLTHARRWTGDIYDRDVPYYDKFPLNKRVMYRAVLGDYRTSNHPKRIAGYMLSFVNNKGIQFDVESPPTIDLRKLDGYLVDATGQIREKENLGHKFILTSIRPIRRYFEVRN
jgi:hypothetical protein